MTWESALSTKLIVNNAYQRVITQIALPKDAVRIIGVEIGWRARITPPPRRELAISMQVPTETALTLQKNWYRGRLSMRVPTCPDIFYQEDIQYDGNFKFGETIHFDSFYPLPISFLKKREECSVYIPKLSKLVEIYYKDEFNDLPEFFDRYQVNVYLWIQRTEK